MITHHIKWIVILGTALLFLSCTTIKISEKEAFDIKRTIDEDYIRGEGLDVERVFIPTTDELELEGWWIVHPRPRGTVLYFGGNGFVRVASHYIIDAFLQHPVNLLVFDYRGYGRNEGTPSVEGLRRDGRAAYTFLIESKTIHPHDLIIHGHSIGSFIATHIATSYDVAGLVLECPITDVKEMTNLLVPWFFRPLVKFDIDDALSQQSNLELIKTFDKPFLSIGGDEDKITPTQMAETLYESAASQERTLLIIEGGSHNDLPSRQEYFQALDSFYHKVLENPLANR